MKVVITPEVSSRKTRKAIIGELVKVHRNTELEKRLPAYDGAKNLYTSGRLPFTQKCSIYYWVRKMRQLVVQGNWLLFRKNKVNFFLSNFGFWNKWVVNFVFRERKFEVQIKFAAQVSMHQLHELLSGKKVDTPQEALNIIDIVLKEFASHRCSFFWQTCHPRHL